MELVIGPHRLVVEQDVLTAYANGPFRLEETKRLLALSEETLSRFGSVYIVTIIGPGYALPPESRKYVAEWSRNHFATGNLIAGAPLAMRTLVTLLSRASQLLGAKNAAVTFVNDEAAALAWIAEHKAQRRQGPLP
jgi:hypothetical protein